MLTGGDKLFNHYTGRNTEEGTNEGLNQWCKIHSGRL